MNAEDDMYLYMRITCHSHVLQYIILYLHYSKLLEVVLKDMNGCLVAL